MSTSDQVPPGRHPAPTGTIRRISGVATSSPNSIGSTRGWPRPIKYRPLARLAQNGKSTLVNALVGSRPLPPTPRTTRIVTWFSRGRRRPVTAVHYGGARVTCRSPGTPAAHWAPTWRDQPADIADLGRCGRELPTRPSSTRPARRRCRGTISAHATVTGADDEGCRASTRWSSCCAPSTPRHRPAQTDRRTGRRVGERAGRDRGGLPRRQRSAPGGSTCSLGQRRRRTVHRGDEQDRDLSGRGARRGLLARRAHPACRDSSSHCETVRRRRSRAEQRGDAERGPLRPAVVSADVTCPSLPRSGPGCWTDSGCSRIRMSVAVLRSGIRRRQVLTDELLDRSGLVALRDVIDQFAHGPSCSKPTALLSLRHLVSEPDCRDAADHRRHRPAAGRYLRVPGNSSAVPLPSPPNNFERGGDGVAAPDHRQLGNGRGNRLGLAQAPYDGPAGGVRGGVAAPRCYPLNDPVHHARAGRQCAWSPSDGSPGFAARQVASAHCPSRGMRNVGGGSA